MKRLMILLLLLAACSPVNEKVFVANEDSGSISMIDAVSLKEIDRVSLTMDHEGARVEFGPHNVQVVEDKVLITANIAHKENSEEENHEEMNHDMALAVPAVSFGVLAVEAHGDEPDEGVHANHADQLIIMDAKSHKITKRIDLDIDAHLAHVVSDGKFAYVTSTNKEVLYVVNLETGGFSFIALPKGSMPHGVRLSGNKAVIAGMNGDLLVVDLISKNIETYALGGKGVQTGVAGDKIMVSVYDTKQLAILENGNLSFVDLPDSKGPVQMYQTPDNRFVYVADQGVYFDQPAGSKTYKIDLKSREVVATIETGFAPHGVVVSPDGRVWVTNLQGNSVSILQNDQKVAEIPVGASPNGISYWSAK